MWGAAGIRHRTKHNLGDDNCHSHIQSSTQHFYMEKIMSFTQEEFNEVEICVSCGAQTSFKKGDDVTFRYGYIQGAGQLCFKCSQTRKMHKTGNYGDSEWTRYG